MADPRSSLCRILTLLQEEGPALGIIINLPKCESRKHHASDPKCSDLGRVHVPMVVETYGAWGKEAIAIISSVASRLATSMCRPKSIVLNEIYGRLNLHLVRAIASAILSRIARLLYSCTLYFNQCCYCIFMLLIT